MSLNNLNKEKYFTQDTIKDVAARMVKNVEGLRDKHKFLIDFKKSALLVLDMQKVFLNQRSHAYIPSSDAIIPNIKKIIDFYTKNNLPIIFTRHLNSKKNAKMMSKWWHHLVLKEDPSSEVYFDIPKKNSFIVEKNQYDAFYNTDLEDILKKKNITQIVICGVMANICCETTARSAFIRGFEVFFIVDATASYNYAFHQASVLNLAHGFAYPLVTREITD